MRAAALRCRIRPMRAEDIAQVLDIERQSFPSMWPQTVYQRELKNELARYLVVYEPPSDPEEVEDEPPGSGVRALMRRILGVAPPSQRDRILGMVGVWCMMGEAHIVTIAVRPELRRQGLGEVLLLAALEAAVETGQQEVTLEHRISNQGARALYEKYGFAQVGVRARYYTDNQEDAVLMTTPQLQSRQYRRLLAERIEAQRQHWGDEFPLDGLLPGLTGNQRLN
jgi:ribosomal-protein-alanine N-acetyltransferase